MSEAGKQIFCATEGMRKFFEDVALLLKTADAGMREHGWRALQGAVSWENSAALEWPRRWVPHFAFRAYVSQKLPSCVAYVTVIMGCQEDDTKVHEPLISAAWFDYAVEHAKWNTLRVTHPYLHLFVPGRTDGGSFTVVRNPADVSWLRSDDVNYSRVATMAVPLASVTGPNELVTAVITPLITSIEAAHKPAAASEKGTS